MNKSEINNILRRLENTKYKIFGIITEIEEIEDRVRKIEKQDSQDTEIEGIQRQNLTTVTKEDVLEKIQDDTTDSSKVILEKNKEEKENELILIGVDGSLVKAKSRTSTATAIIYSEYSILNEVFTTSSKKSSSEPEIIGALVALQKSINLNLKQVVITSDSTSAISFLTELIDNEVKSNDYKKHLENRQIQQLAKSLEKAPEKFVYLALVHTHAHKVVPGCIWTALNNFADTRSRRAAQEQLKTWTPKTPAAVFAPDSQEEDQN